MIYEYIREKLNGILNKNGWSAEALVKGTSVPPATMRDFVNGTTQTCNMDNLMEICDKKLGMSIGQFMEGCPGFGAKSSSENRDYIVEYLKSLQEGGLTVPDIDLLISDLNIFINTRKGMIGEDRQKYMFIVKNFGEKL